MTEIKLWIAFVILDLLYQNSFNWSNSLSTRLRPLGYGVQARQVCRVCRVCQKGIPPVALSALVVHIHMQIFGLVVIKNLVRREKPRHFGLGRFH